MGTARRIARTIFLGSAPSSVVSKTAARGLDRAHIILGCLQPGQTSSVYADALSRLSDRLHYLNASGDERSQDATRFWFDTRANLRREMEDRKRRFDDKTEVRGKIADVLKKTAFKLCRMLLPGGETETNRTLSYYRQSCLIATAAVAEPRSYPCSCFNTQRSLHHASYFVQYALIPTTNLTRPRCRLKVGMCPAKTCDPAKTSSAMHLHELRRSREYPCHPPCA